MFAAVVVSGVTFDYHSALAFASKMRRLRDFGLWKAIYEMTVSAAEQAGVERAKARRIAGRLWGSRSRSAHAGAVSLTIALSLGALGGIAKGDEITVFDLIPQVKEAENASPAAAAPYEGSDINDGTEEGGGDGGEAATTVPAPPVASHGAPDADTDQVTAAEHCGFDPEARLKEVLGERDGQTAWKALGRVDARTAGCPTRVTTTFGTMRHMRLDHAPKAWAVAINAEGIATLLDQRALVAFQHLVAPGGVTSIRGPWSNAPVRPDASPLRRAFVYLATHSDGRCSALIRTAAEEEFVYVPARALAAIVNQVPSGMYVAVTLDDAGNGFVVDVYDAGNHARTTFTVVDDPLGATVACDDLALFLTGYPSGPELTAHP